MSRMQDRKAPKVQDTPDPASEAWNALPWKKFEQHVFRIQKRIYRASQHGNTRTVQKLQKLVMKSEAAQLLAVRRVTQENQGKRTAGVDGVKSVHPKHRLIMAKRIHPRYWKQQKSHPVRRVWIPKPGKTEKRPLGIPTMRERAKQALAKCALEPEWEGKFAPNSYGFRPGRSAHDAIGAIFLDIRNKPKFVFDADIKGCFENIDQTALLEKLHTFTAMRHAIKGWLKAGTLEGDCFTPTETGTPQGGVISPLLANIALHGLEESIMHIKGKNSEKPLMVRYADDFVIFHSTLAGLEGAAQQVTHWLETMGLHLNSQKTQITHTLTPHEGKVGFDFLGHQIRQYPVGKTHTGKDPHGKPLGFKTVIRPSQAGVSRHNHTLKRRIRELSSVSQAELMRALNPIILGWTRYYRTVISSREFHRCDHLMWQQLWKWAKRRHPKKSGHWMKHRYWPQNDGDRWTFRMPEGTRLKGHCDTKIQRHAKVKGARSPFDGNLLYWSQRLTHSPMFNGKLGNLLQRQKGKCAWCRLTFRDGDLIEIDHIDRDAANNRGDNLRALHRHCHDTRHAVHEEFMAQRVAGINHS